MFLLFRPPYASRDLSDRRPLHLVGVAAEREPTPQRAVGVAQMQVHNEVTRASANRFTDAHRHALITICQITQLLVQHRSLHSIFILFKIFSGTGSQSLAIYIR